MSPVTSSPVTSSPVTSSPVTSSPVTSSPVTSSPATSSGPALRIAGALVASAALGFVVVFSMLASTFGYPDVLDRPAAEVLPALIAGGPALKAWWVAYALLPLFISAAALYAHHHLTRLGERARLFTAAGVAAGLAMALGLLRWSTLHWSLGEAWLAEPEARSAIAAVADAANRMLGNGLGEVVGESLLGLWLVGAGLATRAAASRLTRTIGAATLLLAALMITGAWRFAVPALGALTDLTNVLLPLGLIALGLSWLAAKLGARGQTALATVVLTLLVSTSSRAAEPISAPPTLAPRELIVHGFRAPSMGLELRQDWIGFHVGVYPTILDQGPDGDGRTTWFVKTGVTFYPLQFDTGAGRPSAFYAGLALMQGLGNAWDVGESATRGGGGFFDVGFRWAVAKGLDLRLGVGVLVGFDGRIAVNPTPGISWGIAL